MNLDWKKIFTDEGVEFVEQGANVAHNNININCPWCGPDDPSHHLGISLDGKGWGCWRNPAHRGRSPWRLLFKLLGDRAQKYLPARGTTDTTQVENPLRSRFAKPEPQETIVPEDEWLLAVKLAHPLDLNFPDSQPFIHYLRDRGYSDNIILSSGLLAAKHGLLAWRVLCPIWFQDVFQGYTARTIGHVKPRYLTGPGPVDSLNTLTYPRHPKVTVCVEGYFDALRLFQVLQQTSDAPSVKIVATHGTAFSFKKQQQLKLLQRRAPLAFALDEDAQVLAVQYALMYGGVPVEPPPGRKDLGDSTTSEIELWIQQLVQSF